MCSIANIFDRNIIKFDAKNCIFFFFCLKSLNCANPSPLHFIKEEGEGEGVVSFQNLKKKEGSDFSHNGVSLFSY